eukprot:scaffold24817_cov66-Phaeocystis_antarctica.AAC.3
MACGTIERARPLPAGSSQGFAAYTGNPSTTSVQSTLPFASRRSSLLFSSGVRLYASFFKCALKALTPVAFALRVSTTLAAPRSGMRGGNTNDSSSPPPLLVISGHAMWASSCAARSLISWRRETVSSREMVASGGGKDGMAEFALTRSGGFALLRLAAGLPTSP